MEEGNRERTLRKLKTQRDTKRHVVNDKFGRFMKWHPLIGGYKMPKDTTSCLKINSGSKDSSQHLTFGTNP